jgi:beta-catenin-like protein 1
MAEPSQKRQHMEVEQQEEEEVFEQDDEEGGRFFGGGLTSEQHDILDLVDQYDAEEVVMTIANI